MFSPLHEVAIRVRDLSLAAREPVDRRGDQADRPGAAGTSSRPRRGHGLPLEGGQVERPSHRGTGCLDRRSPRPGPEEGLGWRQRIDARLPGESVQGGHDGRQQAVPDDPLGLDLRRHPGTQLSERGRAVDRRSDDDRGLAPASDGKPGRQVAFEVTPQAGDGIASKPVRLVQHDGLTIEPRHPLAQEVVVQDRIVVFLWIGHPDHGVHAGQETFDALTMDRRHRIDVRQVEDGHVARARSVVFPDLVDVQPGEELVQVAAGFARDPGHGFVRGWTPDGDLADSLTGKSVEQARLSHARTADQRHDVDVGGKAEPGLGIDAHRLGRVHRDAQRPGRLDGPDQPGESVLGPELASIVRAIVRAIGRDRLLAADRRRVAHSGLGGIDWSRVAMTAPSSTRSSLGSPAGRSLSSAAPARNSTARSVSWPESGTRRWKRASSSAKLAARSSSRWRRAPPISSTIAASPNSADRSFWLRNAVAAATPTSVPVRPPVWMNVASMTPVPTALTPIEALWASSRFGRPLAWMSAAIPSIQASRRSRRRSSKPTEAPHSVGSSDMTASMAGSSAHAVAVRRAASAACRWATASRSSIVAARTSDTGARAGRTSAEIAPRRRPIPCEKKRVI